MVRLTAPKLRAECSLTIRPFIHAPTAKGGASTLAARSRRQTTLATYEWTLRVAHAKGKLTRRPLATAVTECRHCREAQLQGSDALETSVAKNEFRDTRRHTRQILWEASPTPMTFSGASDASTNCCRDNCRRAKRRNISRCNDLRRVSPKTHHATDLVGRQHAAPGSAGGSRTTPPRLAARSPLPTPRRSRGLKGSLQGVECRFRRTPRSPARATVPAYRSRCRARR
jgi:hypothetical protein